MLIIKGNVLSVAQQPRQWKTTAGVVNTSAKILVGDGKDVFMVEITGTDGAKVANALAAAKPGTEFMAPIDNRVSFVGGINTVRSRVA